MNLDLLVFVREIIYLKNIGAFVFIDFMLKSKILLEYINLYSPNKYEKNDKIILKCFQKILKKLK